jgi:hypothetical protein
MELNRLHGDDADGEREDEHPESHAEDGERGEK